MIQWEHLSRRFSQVFCGNALQDHKNCNHIMLSSNAVRCLTEDTVRKNRTEGVRMHWNAQLAWLAFFQWKKLCHQCILCILIYSSRLFSFHECGSEMRNTNSKPTFSMPSTTYIASIKLSQYFTARTIVKIRLIFLG